MSHTEQLQYIICTSIKGVAMCWATFERTYENGNQVIIHREIPLHILQFAIYKYFKIDLHITDIKQSLSINSKKIEDAWLMLRKENAGNYLMKKQGY